MEISTWLVESGDLSASTTCFEKSSVLSRDHVIPLTKVICYFCNGTHPNICKGDDFALQFLEHVSVS